MKTLLIKPPINPKMVGISLYHIWEPLELEYLAASISEESEVEILDMRLDLFGLHKTLERFHPEVVGITSYTTDANVCKSVLAEVKSWNPETITIIGGHHATVRPSDFQVPVIDYIVKGFGEIVLRDMICKFKIKESLDSTPNLIINEKGSFVSTPEIEINLDIDNLPFPRRDLIEKYRLPSKRRRYIPVGTLLIARGCPFRCSFCTVWKICNRRYYKRKPENIIREIHQIKEDVIFSRDDNSFVDLNLMTQLGHMVKNSSIKKRFLLYARADAAYHHPEIFSLWKEAGLYAVSIGLESIRERDLKEYNKGLNLSNVRESFRIWNDLGVDIFASFIINPDFTVQDFDNLKRFIDSSGIRQPTFAVLTPLIGTDFYNEISKEMISEDLDVFDCVHTLIPTVLPINEFYDQIEKLYCYFYCKKPLLASRTVLEKAQKGIEYVKKRVFFKREKRKILSFYREIGYTNGSSI